MPVKPYEHDSYRAAEIQLKELNQQTRAGLYAIWWNLEQLNGQNDGRLYDLRFHDGQFHIEVINEEFPNE